MKFRTCTTPTLIYRLRFLPTGTTSTGSIVWRRAQKYATTQRARPLAQTEKWCAPFSSPVYISTQFSSDTTPHLKMFASRAIRMMSMRPMARTMATKAAAPVKVPVQLFGLDGTYATALVGIIVFFGRMEGTVFPEETVQLETTTARN